MKGKKIIGIEEKPLKPKTNIVVTGLYFFPNEVFDVIKTLRLSKRKEYEITDVNNYFIEKEKMSATILKGFWSDARTFESLFRASKFVKEKWG